MGKIIRAGILIWSLLVIMLFAGAVYSKETLSEKNLDLVCKDKNKKLVATIRLNNKVPDEGVYHHVEEKVELSLTDKSIEEKAGGRIIRFKTGKGLTVMLAVFDQANHTFIGAFEVNKEEKKGRFFCSRKIAPKDADKEYMKRLDSLPVNIHAQVVVNKLARNSPQRIGKMTMIDRAIAEDNRIIIYKRLSPSDATNQVEYILLLIKMKESEDAKNQLRKNDVSNLCTLKTAMSFLKKGGMYTYFWVDNEYKNLFSYRITEGDCKTASSQ